MAYLKSLHKIGASCSCVGIVRTIYTAEKLSNKNVNNQVKILRKLLGNRESGSKKKWYPSLDSSLPELQNPISFNQPKKQGKNTSRRVAVLNKLFMTYVTDLMATGSVSPEIVGQGIVVTKVNITSDFQFVNVFWFARQNIEQLESTLSKCAGAIRHELSQLRLLGEVPKIHFVKDKMFAKLDEVENTLKECEINDAITKQNEILNQIKNELNLEHDSRDNNPKPVAMNAHAKTSSIEMRSDVFGLNHSEILNKITTKMKKSKQAWEMYEKGIASSHIQTPSVDLQLSKENIKFESKKDTIDSRNEEFEKFLRKRKFKKSKKERHLNYYDLYDVRNDDGDDMSQMYDEDDYIEEYESRNKY